MSIPNTPVKLKLTGDTHLPDVESDLDVEEGTTPLASLARPRDQGGRPQVRHAGVLLAPDDNTAIGVREEIRDSATARRTTPQAGTRREEAPGQDARRGTLRLRPAAGRQQAQPAPGAGRYAIWLVPLAAAALLVRLLR